MGYYTEFKGFIKINPPLNKKEINYLNAFSQSRRMNRIGKNIQYDLTDVGYLDPDVINCNKPHPTQPSLYCQWTPNKNGKKISGDRSEKFYEYVNWMDYIIKHFLQEDAYAKVLVPEKFHFLKPHILNGVIYCKGTNEQDFVKITVKNNKVYTQEGKYTYPFSKKDIFGDEYLKALYSHKIDINKIVWNNKNLINYTPDKEEFEEYTAAIELKKIKKLKLCSNLNKKNKL